MNDTEIAEVIMALNDPREIRQSGKEVKNFSQQLWDDCCEDIVETGNIAKVLRQRMNVLRLKIIEVYSNINVSYVFL